MDKEIYKSIDSRFRKYYKWVVENKESLLTSEEIEKYKYDWPRFAVSIGLLDKYYTKKPKRVLELGGSGVSTKFLNEYFVDWKISNYSEDLRLPNWNLKEKSFDLIINMEVVEHLSDLHESVFEWNASFQYSGFISCMNECKRILKKDGSMFLSTPNVNCYLNLYKMIFGEIPHQYNPHVREYHVDEIRDVISKTNFIVNNFECIEILCNTWDFSYLTKFLESVNGEIENRGSSFFFDLSPSE
jgi:predicted SAM-dependent methyltransferase